MRLETGKILGNFDVGSCVRVPLPGFRAFPPAIFEANPGKVLTFGLALSQNPPAPPPHAQAEPQTRVGTIDGNLQEIPTCVCGRPQ